ncbi:unnamed protein product [Lactuca saligna]|uniref:Uncharacterized protein n=1 Tax=Lactuca saligna TaxID=75948 RepID=A0AA36EPG7_LACSI|nr:unnamed protein product [Lactuca saligna]
MLTVSVRHHLSEKIKLVLAMLNQIKGVSEGDALLKQEGYKSKEKPQPQVKKPTEEQQPKIDMKVYAVFPTKDDFTLAGKHGSRIADDFTLVDLPSMNLNDWISLFLIFFRKMNRSINQLFLI